MKRDAAVLLRVEREILGSCGPAWAGHRAIHVRLNFSGGQCAIVDADFIDAPRKVLAVESIATDAEIIRRGQYWTRLRTVGHLDTIDVYAHYRTIICTRDMGPLIYGQRRCGVEVGARKRSV